MDSEVLFLVVGLQLYAVLAGCGTATDVERRVLGSLRAGLLPFEKHSAAAADYLHHNVMSFVFVRVQRYEIIHEQNPFPSKN